MQYDVNNGLLQVVIEGEEINAVVGEAAKIDVGEAINYIKTGTAEIEKAVQEGITQFNGNATEKTNEFDLNAQDKTSDFNANAVEKTNDFNSNAQNKTGDFNDNAVDKTNDFNDNVTDKTNDFNSNAQNKTGDFNDNAVDKTNDFNDNVTDKTGDFNDNASDKTDTFNLNAQNKTSDFNNNYTEKKGLIDAQVVIAEGAATTATNQAGLAKQWAIGDPSEPTGNSAKYWATQASNSATAAATSEDHAEVWAEGTDQEVQALGGLHSAKGWAAESATGQINSNWTENDPTSKAYIQNKPTAGDNINLANNQISAVSDASPTSSSTKLVQSGGVYTSLNNLQTQIDAIVASSDVFDIVGTYAELQAYDITIVPVNDIIKVLVDSTHNNAATYYRCVESGGVKSWSYIGAEGAYYTKGEADNKFPTKAETGNSLDYTGNTLSLKNASGTNLSSVTIQASAESDNKSITKNFSDELQTVGVINSRDSLTAIKTWTGTRVQYDTIVTKDTNTEYFCTDTGELYLGSVKIGSAGWSNNVTNCITEIPQDIKMQLNNGALILKAGSKVYVPNGFESDGVTPKFDEVEVARNAATVFVGEDGVYNTLVVCLANSTSAQCLGINTINCYSGAVEPSSTNYIWYDTSRNIVIAKNGSVTTENFSLPFVISSVNKSSSGEPSTNCATSIDQVFNGFGYIGSTVFALPGVKGLIPNGRNADGSLKNIEFVLDKVSTTTYSAAGDNLSISIDSDGGIGTASAFIVSKTRPSGEYILWYNPIENLNRYKSTGNFSVTETLPWGMFSSTATRITSLTPKTAFHAVDYNDAVLTSDLATCHVVISRAANTSGGITEIWSDGYCVQTGFHSASGNSGTVNVPLPKEMASTNYTITITDTQTAAGTGGSSVKSTTLTTTSFDYIWISKGITGFYWEVKGYIR